LLVCELDAIQEVCADELLTAGRSHGKITQGNSLRGADTP